MRFWNLTSASYGLAGYIQSGVRERDAEPEGGALAFGGLEVQRSVVPLQDLVGLRQADAAAFRLGGEIQFEDFVLDLGRNPGAGVDDFGGDQSFMAAGADGERASLGHRLNAVDHHVQG